MFMKKVNVREEMNLWIPQGPEACLDMIAREILPVSDGSEASVRSLADTRRVEIYEQVGKVRAYFERLGWDKAQPQVEAMLRYFFEGCNGNGEGYQSDSRVYEQLSIPAWVSSGGSLLDLGCGPGDFIRGQNPKQVFGVDISPSFAYFNPLVRCGVIDAPMEDLCEQTGYKNAGRPAWAFSSLTLDRVRDPARLLENLEALGERVSVATLLPVVPFDDGPEVKNPIEYTPVELRLTPGTSEEEDRRILQTYLEDTFQRRVTAENIPYQCRSSDGVQDYGNYWAFSFSNS